MTIAPTQLGALYTRGAPIVLRRARALSGDEQWSREVVRSVFVKVLEQPRLIEQIRDPVQWLYRTTTRVCLARLRSEDCGAGGGAESLPASGLGETPASVDIARLAASLPPPLDQVAVYAWLDGMRRAEIAAVMGCSERQAGVLLRRAHHTLAEQHDRAEAIGAR